MAKVQGIDYAGLFSPVNRDKETGIRYGVISTRSLHEWFLEEIESDYGDPTCPVCGNAAISIPSHGEQLENGVAIITDMPDAYVDYERYSKHGCDDYACETCEHTLDASDCFPEEAQGWHIDNGEYKVIDCLDSDAMVILSPYFTYAQFCSPCVPGACNLGDPIDPADIGADTVRCYCFGHDWFDGELAPYPVYSVDTGEQILQSAKFAEILRAKVQS